MEGSCRGLWKGKAMGRKRGMRREGLARLDVQLHTYCIPHLQQMNLKKPGDNGNRCCQ